MKIIYSINKKGFEAQQWRREIAASSGDGFEFYPFDHGDYVDPLHYLEAWQLDRLYRERHDGLMRLYVAFASLAEQTCADAVIVDHCPPYHPEFLRGLPLYKVLRSSDDPDSTYRRNIPYLHAYDHVMYLDPAHSADIDMKEKMHYCGMANADLVPHGVLAGDYDPALSENELFGRERDIDLIYIGSFFRQKLPLLARLRRRFGRRFRLGGFFRTKHNLWFNVVHGGGHWVRPISFDERRRLYQRAKIGVNVHWSAYGLGNQRLYHLPANGVMQISDCADHLHHIFEPGIEVSYYRSTDELIDRIEYYLGAHAEREEMARAGYRRTMMEYRFPTLARRMGELIAEGMKRTGHVAAACRQQRVPVRAPS
jgi:spore maturation protein CgeB